MHVAVDEDALVVRSERVEPISHERFECIEEGVVGDGRRPGHVEQGGEPRRRRLLVGLQVGLVDPVVAEAFDVAHRVQRPQPGGELGHDRPALALAKTWPRLVHRHAGGAGQDHPFELSRLPEGDEPSVRHLGRERLEDPGLMGE